MSENEKIELKNLTVFATQEMYWGVPTGLFVNILAFSIGIGVICHSLMLSFLFFFLLTLPMHHVHKADPQAYKVWMRNLGQRHTRWAAGQTDGKRLIILDKE